MAEKVLVVDDDLDTLRLVGLLLQRQGYQILAASSGTQALNMAASERPDIILLDAMMPDMDGFEVTRRIRQQPALFKIPIILFTARSQTEDKIQGMQAGADDYLTKPTQPREMFAHVRALLDRAAQERAASGQHTAASKTGAYNLGVLSARGGSGVSTLALNLGICLRQQSGGNVIVADYRPGASTLDLELGVSRPEGLNHLLQRRTSEPDIQAVQNELFTHASGTRFLLASAQPADARLLAAIDAFKGITSRLVEQPGLVVFDLGASLTPLALQTLEVCHEVLVAVTPTLSVSEHTRALVNDLGARGFIREQVRLAVIQRSPGPRLSDTQVQELAGARVAASFPYAPELFAQAVEHVTPVVLLEPDGPVAMQFHWLAEAILLRKS